MDTPITSFLAFAGLWFAQVAVPGPNFVRVSQAALERSRATAMKTAAGTAAGNCTWCLASILGASAIAADPMSGRALRVAGALYFAGYGGRLLLRAVRREGGERMVSPVDAAQAFWAGFLTAIASPQAGIFFATALMAIFPDGPTQGGAATVLAVVAGVTLGWYAIVTAILAAPSSRVRYQRFRPVFEAVFGVVLLAASTRLLMLAS
jgi:threonine/homoserine/homoserine lactone efflux protein